MRVFQNFGLSPSYRRHLKGLAAGCRSHSSYRSAFLADRHGACHYLLPLEEGAENAAATCGDDVDMQGLWAHEQGLPRKTDLATILRCQIEQHRTEVFYNLDPMRYGNDFVRNLPGCVKHTLAWHAAPSSHADFSAFGLLVCNFPGILDHYRARGWRASYLPPSHDPEMDLYAGREDRPVDVLFVGGYSRHHRRRADVLERVAGLADRHVVRFHLDVSRATRWAESPLGRWLPLARRRRPPEIRRVSAGPVFGRALYAELGAAKIVLNGAVDMAGEDRGNMRCFEAMGCATLMVSDTGRYPDGMADGATMLTYTDPANAVQRVESALLNPAFARPVALRGHELVRTAYSKERQWQRFLQLVAEL